MNTFTVIFFCIQACLVQNVFSQCTSRAAVVAEPGLIAPGLAPYGLGSPLAYGGLGGWDGVAPAAAAIAPGLAGPYGLASSLAYDGLAAATIAPAAAYRGGLGGLAYPAAIGYADDIIAPYGGVGEGNVAVAGELPVAGTTAVAGQVPIMGAVSFGGPVNAAGAVTITGQCACAVPTAEYLF